MEQVTSAAKPDPWLAQKVRVRAQGKEEQHMKKKLPAGAAIVIAVMLLMTAVAAAVTNGFGLIKHFPDQAENTAFTDRIMTIGQTWEGKYFDAEISEAVFDGAKLRFTMSVTPKEGAERVYVIPSIKATSGSKIWQTNLLVVDGPDDGRGFWVPEIEPPCGQENGSLDDMIFEADLQYSDNKPITIDQDVQWTVTFNVLHTDWNIAYSEYSLDDIIESDPDSQNAPNIESLMFKLTNLQGPATINSRYHGALAENLYKLREEAYARHELLLYNDGYGLEEIILYPFEDEDGILCFEGDLDEYIFNLYKRDVFTQEEEAVFSFEAERAEILKLPAPVSFTLPEEQKYTVPRAEATADGINVLVTTKYLNVPNEFYDDLEWEFVLKSDEPGLLEGNVNYDMTHTDAKELYVNHILQYVANRPLHTVTLVPVQHTADGPVARDDLAVILNLE